MDRQQRVPVGDAEEAARLVDRPQRRHRGVADDRLGAELEPGPSRHLHLRGETEAATGFHRLDPPPVDAVAGPKVGGGRAAAPQADTADESVDAATDAPEDVQVEPAHVATEAGDHLPHRGGRRVHAAGAMEHDATRPVVTARVGEGPRNRLVVADGTDGGQQRTGGGIGHHGGAGEALDQGPREGGGNRGHQVDPQ